MNKRSQQRKQKSSLVLKNKSIQRRLQKGRRSSGSAVVVESYVSQNGLVLVPGHDYVIIDDDVVFTVPPKPDDLINIKKADSNGKITDNTICYSREMAENNIRKYLKRCTDFKRKTSVCQLRKLVLDCIEDNLKVIEILDEFGLQEE